MAVRMTFDTNGRPIPPTFVLANRNGNKLGAIPATSINFSDQTNGPAEFQCTVYRDDTASMSGLFDEIQDFKFVWCPEWDEWFEITVEIVDGEGTVKNVSGKAVGEAELSQLYLYEYEINTETDIARDDYVTTVLYNPEDPKGSLLDRILEKAPHYDIGHVDESIAGIQRTFTFDNTSILDALYQIAEEIDCIFEIDSSSKEDGSIARTINAYDLETICDDCGYRGVYSGICPECGSTNLSCGYGKDTNIYVSTENLTDEITYSSNTDQVKNCFRLIGGDDLMTATIANCNPNGSSYLWYFSDAMKEDMSDELRDKIDQYEAEYNYYANQKQIIIPQNLVTGYNNIVTKYRTYRPDLNTIISPIVGYSDLMTTYYDTIDFEMYLRHELMPTIDMSGTTAAEEAAKLTATVLSPTAVTNLAACSLATASSAVQSVAKDIVRRTYQVKVNTATYANHVWSGSFIVTNYSDEEDTATTGTISVTITDDQETYLKQRINKSLTDTTDGDTSITALFKLSLASFTNEIKKYCLTSLNSFRDICQSCVDILIDQGIADKKTWGDKNPDLYTELYVPFYQKLNALIAEVAVRESELLVITGAYDDKGGLLTNGVHTVIQAANEDIQNHLDIEKYFGTELMEELSIYRREDLYENTNYISDGLDNSGLFERALEFIEQARGEIYKAATLQHTITSTLKNLLVMKEFAPIVDSFEIGNWITVRADDKLCRLRLMSYEVDFDNLENLNVEFSDVVETIFGENDLESIVKSASSISTSFGSVKRQASRGNTSANTLLSFATNGLSLTKMKILDSAENQNITIDHHGLLCRELVPYVEQYDDKQVRIINKGLYVTDDGWESCRAGVGNFIYYDPETGEEKEGYGVISDLLVGNLILSEEVGVYNKRGTIKLDQDGLTIISANDGNPRDVFRIQKRDGSTVANVLYIDDSGNAHFAGRLEAASGTFEGTLSAACITSGTLSADRIGANSIAVGKLTGSISNNNWVLDLTNGTFTIGNISAANINAGTLSADRIGGGTITSTHLSTAVNNSISTAQTTANSANGTTQIIYISKASGTSSVSAPSSFITDTTGNQNTWTLKRPVYNSSYPVLFVATQRKTVGGTVTCTTPVKDETTTVIDGGHITTGTIDASKATITNINAGNISTGTLNASRISDHSLSKDKLSGSITNGNWALNFTNGTFSIGNISADNITTGTLSADRISAKSIGGAKIADGAITTDKITANGISASKIKGDTLTLGGSNNINGILKMVDGNGLTIGTWDNNGINLNKGSIVFDVGTIATVSLNHNLSPFNIVTYAVRNGSFVPRIETSISNYGTYITDLWDTNRLTLDADSVYLQGHSSSAWGSGISIGHYVDSSSLETKRSVGINEPYDDDTYVFYVTSSGAYKAYIKANGSMAMSGTKSRVVSTDQYSDRLLYCYETPSPMFGDIGEGITSEDGKCYIYIDPVFSETITTNQYQVFLQKYGNGNCWVSERHGSYFVVEGTPGLAFGWEIKAKQRDYDQRRLDRDDEPFSISQQSYGNDAANYIEELMKGRIEE